MGILNVVVGIDGTESSDHAMHFAIGLAAREHVPSERLLCLASFDRHLPSRPGPDRFRGICDGT